MTAVDFDAEYRDYVARVEAAVGDVLPGEFVKFEGQLVKRLDFAGFVDVYTAYFDAAKESFRSNERGNTVNDAVVKGLREKARQLFLNSPV